MTLGLLLQVDLSLKDVVNVGFLVVTHHTAVVIICACHPAISVLKHLNTLLWVILQTPPYW